MSRVRNAARLTYVCISLAVAAAAAVSFALSTLFLRIGKQEDGDITSATAKMEQMKGKKSSVSGALTGGGAAGAAGVAADDSDRKSTRLNSSHVAISYAVF